MEKNCRHYIKIEPEGKMIVYWRCLEDGVETTGLCVGHLAKKIVEENDRVISLTHRLDVIQ